VKYDPEIHHRRSIRLQGYDYSRAGAYFVTICTQGRESLFGEIVDGEMRSNDPGLMILGWYNELENKFPDIQCDAFVCMPNHVHFIVVNTGVNAGADLCVRPVGADLCVRPDPTRTSGGEHDNQGERVRTPEGEHIGSPLRGVVQWFKTMSTNAYIRGVKQQGWPPFRGKLWQRNYWERIVRNETELNRIRAYIQDNPAQWESDQLHPNPTSPHNK